MSEDHSPPPVGALEKAATALSALLVTDVTIDWVPGRSTRHAVAIFGRDDAKASQGVRAEVRGYAVP
jgi:hypothetical protein